MVKWMEWLHIMLALVVGVVTWVKPTLPTFCIDRRDSVGVQILLPRSLFDWLMYLPGTEPHGISTALKRSGYVPSERFSAATIKSVGRNARKNKKRKRNTRNSEQ
jgi:hypothetical protein